MQTNCTTAVTTAVSPGVHAVKNRFYYWTGLDGITNTFCLSIKKQTHSFCDTQPYLMRRTDMLSQTIQVDISQPWALCHLPKNRGGLNQSLLTRTQKTELSGATTTQP